MTQTYNAEAIRQGKWWVVTVEGAGTTQAKTLREAKEMATDLIAVMNDVPESAIEVNLLVILPPHLAKEVQAAKNAQRDVEVRQAKAAQKSRKVAYELVKVAGLSGKDASEVLGLSPQRVSQLLTTE